MPRVLVIIVNYRSAALTLASVRELCRTRDNMPGLSVHVVENDSGDGELLQAGLSAPEYQGWVNLTLAPRNGGFAYGNNIAIRSALRGSEPPEFFFLLNPDATVQPLAIERLTEFMEQNLNIGIAGARLVNGDGSEWNFAFRFPNVLGELERGIKLGIVSKLLARYVVAREMPDEPTQVDWLPGAAMLIRREVFERIGLMDESYFLYYEETDFCLAAARAGFECWYYPHARVTHLAGHSTGVTKRGVGPQRLPAYFYESRRRFFIKNFGLPYAAAADAAHIVGATAYKLRMALERRENTQALQLVGDSIRHFSLIPRNTSIQPTKNQ